MRVLTCVYCGHEYPQDTPVSGHQILTEHISQCDRHPMKKVSEDLHRLRKAVTEFLDLVKSTDRELGVGDRCVSENEAMRKLRELVSAGV